MNLYSRKKFLASAALLLACAGLLTTAVAQRRKAHKLRATALVEVTTDAKGVSVTHVIPITVLDDGQFQDASIYKASPRPMALEDGIVYEAQTSGIPVANATVLSGANTNGWTALGRWQVVTAPVKKPDAPPSVSAPNDGRPILRRPGASASDAGSASPSATPAPDSSSTTSTGGTSSSTDDRPVLRRPNESAPATSATPTPVSTPTPSASSTPSDQTSTDRPSSDRPSNDRPTLHRPSESAPNSAPSPTPSSSPASPAPGQSAPENAPAASEDPDRPTLRRRDSPQQGPPPPPQSQPTKAEAGAAGPKKPVTPPGTTKTFVAVSDTQSSDIRSFDFKWKTGEEESMELKMRKLALAQIPKQTVQRTKESAQLTPKSLKNVVMRSFDLDLSNDAVIVLSAEVPATVLSTKESDAKFISRYVTVVARVDFEGEPEKVLASVTDSSRLDVTPRLELIDAVDVDGDGVAELLFREYGYGETSFAVYGIGRSTATRLFEGASRPLK